VSQQTASALVTDWMGCVSFAVIALAAVAGPAFMAPATHRSPAGRDVPALTGARQLPLRALRTPATPERRGVTRAWPTGPGGLRVGMVVYDRVHEMVAVVDGFAGLFVNLSRPTGLTWQSRWVSVRAGTAYEQRQLRAIAALHMQQRKGLPDPER
jgi:hypothetical protein